MPLVIMKRKLEKSDGHWVSSFDGHKDVLGHYIDERTYSG